MRNIGDVGAFLIAAVVALVIIAVMLYAYARFIALRARVQSAWHAVDAALHERHNLVPTLIDTVRPCAPQETRLLDTATSLNLTAMAVHREADAQALAEQALEHVVHQVVAIGERHLKLRRNAEFRALQQRLAGIEARIEELQAVYNAETRSFDRLVQTFPTLIVAHMFGFAPEPYFEVDAGAGHVPAPLIDLSPWT